MSGLDNWADAIAFRREDDGRPALVSVANHVRHAITEAGFVRHGRITAGLREAYGPFMVDDTPLSEIIDEALGLLLLIGDIGMFTTSAGRGYAATPPRRIAWGGDRTTVLGAVPIGPSSSLVRQVSPLETISAELAAVSLTDELGRCPATITIAGPATIMIAGEVARQGLSSGGA